MSQTSEHEKVLRGATWLLFGVAGGLLLDLFAKRILETYTLTQFVLLRSAIGLGLLLLIAPRFGGLQELRTRRYGWHVLRTLLAIGAMFGFFYGLARMPLVNALTLGFTAPLMVTGLAAMFLREPVGWRRWSAVAVGFVGVLVILRPGGGDVSFAAIAILFAALFYAGQAITARHLGDTESTFSLSFYVMIGPLLVSGTMLDTATWISPDLEGWVLFLCAAIASVMAWIGFVNGYRSVSPATLAPLEYLALVGGAIAGYVFWDEIPDRWVAVGALIIVASNIFVVYRGERRRVMD